MSSENISVTINKEHVFGLLEYISHILISIIFVITLKERHPYILFLLLTGIIAYLIYSQEISNPALIVTAGFITYGIRMFIKSYDKTIIPNEDQPQIQNLSTIWEIPFWCLTSYYLVSIAGMIRYI